MRIERKIRRDALRHKVGNRYMSYYWSRHNNFIKLGAEAVKKPKTVREAKGVNK